MADWQKALARFAHRVESKIDQTRQKHGLTGGRGAHPRIDAYRSFGTAEHAFVKGRVLRGSPVPAAEAGHSVWINLAGMIQRFESDEVPGARVRILFPGGEATVSADEEGYFEHWFHPRPAFSPHALWHTIQVELLEPAPEDARNREIAHVLVPPPQSAFGVISDLDDTVIQTGAVSPLRMARTVLLGNAHTRTPFPGVAAFYRALQQGAGSAPFNPVFYVSSSPWNLHDLLAEFLVLQKIPLGPLMLRDWGLSAEELLPTGHGRHKLAAIRRILDLYPDLSFLLIGDSGQEDPEIYHRVVHDYPDRILAVYIRSVHPDPSRIAAVRALAGEVQAAGSTLILADDTAAAARHAAGRGWIAGHGLAEVERAVRAEESAG